MNIHYGPVPKELGHTPLALWKMVRDKLKTKLFKLNLGYLTSDFDADFLSESEKSHPCYERKRFRKNSGFHKKIRNRKNCQNRGYSNSSQNAAAKILRSKLSAFET